MALDSIKTKHQYPGRRIAWNEALRFPQSLNEQMLALLVKMSDTYSETPDWADWIQVRRALLEIDPPVRQSLALCPFLLLDAGFRDPMRWQQTATNATHLQTRETPVLVDLDMKLLNLARATCILGWHLARTDQIAARLILDASPECADAIARLNLTDLQEIAERMVLFRQFKPRWHDRPEVWRRLIQLAQTSPRRAFASVNIRGRQLFLGDDLSMEETP